MQKRRRKHPQITQISADYLRGFQEEEKKRKIIENRSGFPPPGGDRYQ